MSLASLALGLRNETKLEILGHVSGLLRFSDLLFEESSIRRNFIVKNIDAALRDTLSSRDADEWLFGVNLEDKLEAAKALAVSSGVLKSKVQPMQGNSAKNFRDPPRRQVTKRQENLTPGGQISNAQPEAELQGISEATLPRSTPVDAVCYAGCLKNFLNFWEKLTSNKNVLS